MLILKIPVRAEPSVAFINENYLVMTYSEKPDAVMTVKQFPLTDVGKEIATLIEGNLSDDDFRLFAEKIREKSHITVSAHKINTIEENGNINYQIKDALPPLSRE